MSWLGLISSLASILSAFVTYLAQQKAINGALAERLAAHLSKVNEEILDAQTIRDSVNARTPDELHNSKDGLWRDGDAAGNILPTGQTDKTKP